jgi:hypothetical protein
MSEYAPSGIENGLTGPLVKPKFASPEPPMLGGGPGSGAVSRVMLKIQ